jgi:hypothetical protein
MRTTVTLDPDVDSKLRQMARERGVSFKVALNAAIRAGLGGRARAARRYRLETRRMGVRAGIDLDRAARLAGDLEDTEIVRKLELRK